MTKTIKVRSPAPAHSASSISTRIKNDRRRRGRVAGRPPARSRPRKSPTSTASRMPRPTSPTVSRKDVDAVILCTPTQMHAAQAIACLKAGKHVQVEIPLADSLADAEAVVDAAEADRPGRDVRPYPPLQSEPPVGAQEDRRPASSTCSRWTCRPIFFRRTNMNALGQPRSWTDHLLWHHAAHTVDLFDYQTRRSPIVKANAVQGPIHPDLGIAMDMSIQLKAPNGAICTLSPVVQQRRPARHLLPLHLRQRHLHRALRRPLRRQGRTDRRVQGRCVDERHRAAGPRVLRRHPRRPRAERQRRAGAAVLPGAARHRPSAGCVGVAVRRSPQLVRDLLRRANVGVGQMFP